MRIIIFSQGDSITIPKNIIKLNKIDDIEILSVIEIANKGALKNKKLLFLKGFGIMQASKLGLIFLWKKILNFLDLITFYSFLETPHCLSTAAKRCNAIYHCIDNPNDKRFLDDLVKMNVDICVSFSSPSVFGKRLLSIPSYGCINLHCSLLPKYAGLLPSFWALYHNEKKIGATVHYMDDKIDNGEILGQIEVKAPINPSMFKVIKLTKGLGGDLMSDVICSIKNKTLKPQRNIENKGNYYSWPSIEQIRNFRKNGGRLI